MTEKDSKEPFIPADERGETIPKLPDWVLDAIAKNAWEQLPVDVQRPDEVPWMESVKHTTIPDPFETMKNGKLKRKK